MFTVLTVVTALLAGLLVFTAVRKLSHAEAVVRSYGDVGVPEDKLNLLAAILLAGAAGLVVGLWWRPLGVAAAIGVACYFLLAVVQHVRAKDSKHLPTPLAYETLAIAALALHIAGP
ncbi:MAG: DoxX family protein [Jiangellaceae bacterium]